MGKNRSPNRDKAFEIYRDNGGRIAPKEIASILKEKLNNIYSWKNKDKWKDRIKPGAPPGNKNAIGNKGGGAPIGNLNRFKNGSYIDDSRFNSKRFLAKYVPKVTANIIDDITENKISSLEMLWSSILLKFAAILRTQKIMYVKNKKDTKKELKKESWGKPDSKEYEIQFAWDKQANLLQAQSKAMRELTNMITQYENLANKNWDYISEAQRLRIEKLKVAVTNLNDKNLNVNSTAKLDSILSQLEDKDNE